MMELHSYAKRRALKKWTIEQKRKLVDVRISHDAIFSKEPRNSVLPWKKILGLAKLDDFNVFFVRKQWSNMVARYKQYKQSRLGSLPSKAIDNEIIQKITQEWEFFQPIHHFMTHKTTNLHSYALQRQAEPVQLLAVSAAKACARLNQTVQQQQQQASSSSTEHINMFSSDTNEDFAVTIDNIGNEFQQQIPTTDHDFYAFSAATANGEHQPTLCYFADASEDTQESMAVEIREPIPVAAECVVPANGTVKVENIAKPLAVQIQVDKLVAPSGSQPNRNVTKEESCLSERDKYYRHKRRFNRRLERRFDSLLNVFGQIVRAEYPSIDVNPLLGSTAAGVGLVNRFLSSDDEDEPESAAEEPSTEEETSVQAQHRQ